LEEDLRELIPLGGVRGGVSGKVMEKLETIFR